MSDDGEVSALRQWLDVLEGAGVYAGTGENPHDNPLQCDFCSDIIHKNSQVTHYAADRLLNPWILDNLPTRPFWLLRTYCPTCDRRRIQYPCEGYNELIVASGIDHDHCYRDLEVIDVSNASDGYAWDPMAVVDALYDLLDYPIDYEDELRARSRMYPTMGFGPEDVADKCRIYDVHPGKVLNEDGELAIPPGERRALANRIAERMDRVGEIAGDRKAWRDIARDS